MRLALVKIILTPILILFFVGSVSAETLTLDDCIELALKNRANIIIARGNERLASANKLRAFGQFLPSLDASYTFNKGEQTNIDPPFVIPIINDTIVSQELGPDKSLTFSAGMSLFNLSNWFNYFGSRASHSAAHLATIDTEQELIFSVKTTYYNYLRALQNEEVNEQAVERSKEQLKLVESRYELGSAAYSDVLSQRVQYGNDRLELLKAKNNTVTSKAVLSYTTGIDANRDVEFATVEDAREYEGTLKQAIDFGMRHEPGLLSASEEFNASKHGVNFARADYVPKLTVFGRYTDFAGTQAFPEVIDYSFNQLTYGFTISYSIIDGFSRQREVSRAKINRNNAMATLTDTRNLVNQEIKTAYLDIQNQKEAVTVAAETVTAAEEDMKIERERYKLGAATILDLLQAQEDLKRAQVSLINAKFVLNLSIARLENSMGKP